MTTEKTVAALEREAERLMGAGDTAGARRMLAAHDRALAQLRGELEPVTAEELVARERDYQDATLALEAAREARSRAIRDAIADGWSYRRVGEVLGVSRGRVYQLAREEVAR